MHNLFPLLNEKTLETQKKFEKSSFKDPDELFSLGKGHNNCFSTWITLDYQYPTPHSSVSGDPLSEAALAMQENTKRSLFHPVNKKCPNS